MEPPQAGNQGGNADYPWDDFDSANYLEHNYSTLHPADLQILDTVRDFFFKTDRSGGASRGTSEGRPARGLDVGTGTNLYPALAMLPFCAELTLWEYSAGNARWLREEVRAYSEPWDPFWDRLALSPPYQDISDPRSVLADRARVQQGSIFDLPAASWDIGTMFFVAESLTTRYDEFEAATHAFVGALRPNAPFAVAFMENSTGYQVGVQHFPAVPVTIESVRSCLDSFSGDLDVQRVGLCGEPLREGYSGMIMALGTVHAS